MYSLESIVARFKSNEKFSGKTFNNIITFRE